MKKMLILFLTLAFSLPLFAQVNLQEFPETPKNYSTIVDPNDPLKTIYSGAFKVKLLVGNEERSVLVYLAEGFSQTQGFLMIVPSSGMTATQCLMESGWKNVADKNNLYLMILEPDRSFYDPSYEGRDFAYITAATKLADTRNYWRQPEG